MTEVLMIGILITVVKMTSLATVVPQPGLFAFGALTLLLAIVVSFDPKALWNLGDDLTRQALPGMRYKAFAPGEKVVPCHACGLVAPPLGKGRHLACVRCGSTLHVRKPDSISRTWALLIAAMILYIPANLLPVMVTYAVWRAERHHHERRGAVLDQRLEGPGHHHFHRQRGRAHAEAGRAGVAGLDGAAAFALAAAPAHRFVPHGRIHRPLVHARHLCRHPDGGAGALQVAGGDHGRSRRWPSAPWWC
jgi:hypothetical protein